MVMPGLLSFLFNDSLLGFVSLTPTCPPYYPQPIVLTAAMAFVKERAVGACEIVDELVLSNEERALGGNGIMDGG